MVFDYHGINGKLIKIGDQNVKRHQMFYDYALHYYGFVKLISLKIIFLKSPILFLFNKLKNCKYKKKTFKGLARFLSFEKKRIFTFFPFKRIAF